MKLNLEKISANFLSQIVEIESNSPNVLVCSEQAISLSRNVLNRYKRDLLLNNFTDIESEIDFFKKIKQIPLTPLIYYSEVRSFELQFPLANRTTQKKYINKKIRKLNRFFTFNLDFIQYIEQKHSHFDLQYFTRKYLDTFHIVSSKFYFQDPDFTTSRDMLLGKVKAYRRFIKYLQNRLKLKNSSQNKKNGSKLKWTSSKTALTELIYALYHSNSLNNGNTDIKEIAAALQETFQFDLGDFYKIYSEIKSRKISRTKFLDDLSAGLITQMNSSEE